MKIWLLTITPRCEETDDFELVVFPCVSEDAAKRKLKKWVVETIKAERFEDELDDPLPKDPIQWYFNGHQYFWSEYAINEVECFE